MSTHTPWPWKHLPNIRGAAGCEIRGATGEMIADIYDAGPLDGSARIANARLIAAAPDLLAALKEVREVFHLRCTRGESIADGGFDGGRITRSINSADAAIAKAEGRE